MKRVPMKPIPKKRVPAKYSQNKTKAWFWMSMVLGITGCHLPSMASTPLNPQKVLEFPISKGGLTRISIDNDGIEDIYAYPKEYADNISNHKSGHVFVVADDLEGPFYVTLITKRGFAQDLKLVPRSKKAEPILLSFEDPQTGRDEKANSHSQEVYASILSQFVRGVVPEGFSLVSSMDASSKEVSRGAGAPEVPEAILEKAYQNDKYRVLIFDIKNDMAERITLDNRVFWGKGNASQGDSSRRDLASVFDQPALNPQESAKLYVIQHR
jgi:hypothetical protein